MKILKFIGVAIFMIAIFLSCKKTEDNPLATAAANDVSLKNGVVTFSTTADYLAAIENGSNKQEQLFSLLKENNFIALRQKAIKPNANGGAGINSFTNAFDTSLYTKYLLDVLNQDKICSINGYLVKVDMDNVFCSVLDQIRYASESADLVNNRLTNPHIMTFLNPNEPVLEVLARMRNNELTWAQYQDSLARKGNQGICFKSGASPLYNSAFRDVNVNGRILRIFSEASYTTAFVSFELVAYGSANGNGISDWVSLNGRYEYEGACKGSGNATIRIPATGWRYRFLAYGGGSALRVRKLETTTSTRYYGSAPKASIGY
jgi:hypothetical protein